MIRAGTPATTVQGGTSRVTTVPAPTTALSPIRTPGRITAFALTQTLAPIVIGRASNPREAMGSGPRPATWLSSWMETVLAG